MARKRKKGTLRDVINKNTGVSSSVNGARGVYLVNAGKAEAGKASGFGTRNQRYQDMRIALGLSAK